jgi:WD40 repeat protein
VTAIALTPDGKTLAAVNWGDAAVRLWDLATGKDLGRLEGHADGVCAVAFAPDGSTIATGSRDQTVRLWDLATRRNRLLPDAPQGPITAVAFAPAGNAIATASGRSVRLWDPVSGRTLRELAAGSRSSLVMCLAFSPDGKMLASGEGYPISTHQKETDRYLVRLWDVATGQEVRQFLPPHTDAIAFLAFSPDGRTLASAGGGQISWMSQNLLAWAKQQGKEIDLTDNAVRLWDVATGVERRRLKGHHFTVHGLAFSPDGNTLAATDGTASLLWDAATGKLLRTLAPRSEVPGYAMNAVTFAPDGRTLAMAVDYWQAGTRLPDRSVRLWRPGTGREIPRRLGEAGPAACLTFSPDGALLAEGYGDGSVRLVEFATGRTVARLRGHDSGLRTPGDQAVRGVTAVAFSPDGRRLVSGGADTTALVWDVTGQRDALGASGGVYPRRDKPGGSLGRAGLERCWLDLLDADASRAHRAVWMLVAAPEEAVPFLGERLRRVAVPPDPKRLAQLVADLDSDRFAVREQASGELARLGDWAAPALRQALQGKPSPEVRRRAEEVLRQVEVDEVLVEEIVRGLRAMRVLEQAGTAEARAVLGALARDDPDGRLGREARQALARLSRVH